MADKDEVRQEFEKYWTDRARYGYFAREHASEDFSAGYAAGLEKAARRLRDWSRGVSSSEVKTHIEHILLSLGLPINSKEDAALPVPNSGPGESALSPDATTKEKP